MTFSILAGKHSLEDMEGERRSVVKAVCHPGFNRTTFQNDVAVFKFDRPIEFTNTIKAIRLPVGKEDKDLPGMECVVAGWGVSGVGKMLAEGRVVLLKFLARRVSAFLLQF